MKTSIGILFAFMAMVVGGVHGQGLYVKLGGGYGMPLATQSVGENYKQVNDYTGATPVYTFSSENVKGSYGAGMNGRLTFGYTFSEFMGLEIGVDYLSGKKIETRDEDIDLFQGFTGITRTVVTKNSKGLFFHPTLVFAKGTGTYPYGKVGIVAGFPSISETRDYYYDGDGVDIINMEGKYSGGMAMGFMAGFGMNFKITDKLSAFAEINFTSLSYYQKEYEVTKFIHNGQDVLGQVPVNQKKVLYKDKIDPTVWDSNQPTQTLKEENAFSSISLQGGIKYTLFVGWGN